MISLDHLRTFKQFVDSGSMAAAAKQLAITQPAVSNQLKKLEADFQKPLFMTEGTKKILSPHGRALYQAISIGVDGLKQALERFRSGETGLTTIRIAGREEFLAPFLSRAALNDVTDPIDVISCSSEEAARMVTHHEADIALSYHVPRSSDIIAKKAFTSDPVFAYTKKLMRSLEPQNLRAIMLEQPLLAYRRDDPLLLEICEILEIDPGHLRFSLITSSWRMIQQGILLGRGFGILPSIFTTDAMEFCKVTTAVKGLQRSSQFEYYVLYQKAKRRELRAAIELFG